MDEFDIGDFSTELDDAKKLLDLGIGSPTLKKQIFKRLALQVPVRRAAGDQEPGGGGDRGESEGGT